MSSQDVLEIEKDVIERYAVGEQNESLNASSPSTTKTAETGFTRITSNVLSRIASHLSSRDVADPGPPPDGGLQAWIQVIMAFFVCFCTWYECQ
jgi:hypothetical protein